MKSIVSPPVLATGSQHADQTSEADAIAKLLETFAGGRFVQKIFNYPRNEGGGEQSVLGREASASADRRGSGMAHQRIVSPGRSFMIAAARLAGFVAVSIVSFVFAATGGTKLLITDPLTGLPLHPATDSRLHLGNEPTRLPESQVCKSTMRVDFYSVYDSKVNATLAWYDAHLPAFKKTHAYSSNRSQDTYYKSDGTVLVSVTGSPGKEGENMDTYSVLYARLQPGLNEKTIVALNQQRVVCP